MHDFRRRSQRYKSTARMAFHLQQPQLPLSHTHLKQCSPSAFSPLLSSSSPLSLACRPRRTPSPSPTTVVPERSAHPQRYRRLESYDLFSPLSVARAVLPSRRVVPTPATDLSSARLHTSRPVHVVLTVKAAHLVRVLGPRRGSSD